MLFVVDRQIDLLKDNTNVWETLLIFKFKFHA